MAENVTQYCHVCKSQTTSGPPVARLTYLAHPVGSRSKRYLIIKLRVSINIWPSSPGEKIEYNRPFNFPSRLCQSESLCDHNKFNFMKIFSKKIKFCTRLNRFETEAEGQLGNGDRRTCSYMH